MAFDPVTELQRCMALVRPVGMSDGAVRDWLSAAMAEIADLSPEMIRKGCDEARKTCTHHGQIIPTIRKANADLLAFRRKQDALCWDQPGHSQHRVGYSGAKRIGNLKLVEGPRGN